MRLLILPLLIASIAAQTKTQSTYLSGAFSPDVAKLPPSFMGHDIEALFVKLNASGALKPKSEFETNEQYRARMKLGQDGRQLVFVLRTGDTSGGVVTFAYDADSQT